MTDDPARKMVPCPECDNGRVYATFVYTNGDTTDVPAECPYCGGAGTVFASKSPRV